MPASLPISLHHQAREFFDRLPLLPPKEAYAALDEAGYRGQDEARRALTLMAYRHVRRLKRIYLEGVDRRQLPPKSNALLLGPTGCGKTHLIELLFRNILRLPTVICDMTGFSETGYIGDDTKTIMTRLLVAADGDPLIASAGIVCLDEFDKLASSQNNGRFDGQGTTKDVSGFGVQRELLRLLEPTTIEVPTDFNNSSYSQRQEMYTGDVTFVASGAFSGLKLTSQTAAGEYEGGQLGFGARYQRPSEAIAVQLEDRDLANIEAFQRYGFLPELIGRFTRVVALQPLDEQTLAKILEDNVIGPFRGEFDDEGLELVIDDAVLEYVVELSVKRQTGARGLTTLLTQHLEAVAFERFCGTPGVVRVTREDDRVVSSFEPSKRRATQRKQPSRELPPTGRRQRPMGPGFPL